MNQTEEIAALRRFAVRLERSDKCIWATRYEGKWRVHTLTHTVAKDLTLEEALNLLEKL